MRAPEGDHVVVDLAVGGDFHQFDDAVAPVADRLDPEGGALFIVAFQVLVVDEGAFALGEAEAARAGVLEGADLEVAGIGERAPDRVVVAGVELQAVGIVHGGAPVVEVDAVVGIEQEHRGERGEAGLGDVDARVGGGFGVEDGVVAGTDGEAEGGGGAGAVEQSVDDDDVGARAGRSSQNERKTGNSSPVESAVLIDRPRAERP